MAKRPSNSNRRSGGSKRVSDSDDAFVAGVLEFSHWARTNQTTLVVFGVALAAIVLGVIYWSNAREAQLREAGIRLEQIQVSLAGGDSEAAKVGLSQYLEQFGDTPYGGEAALILGELYLESDQPDLALRALDRVDIGPADPLGPQALTLEARALEMSGELAAAEEIYLRVADRAEFSFERIAARASAARIRQLRGDPSGAAELYREILEGMEANDPQRGQYEMRLAEVETEARG